VVTLEIGAAPQLGGEIRSCADRRSGGENFNSRIIGSGPDTGDEAVNLGDSRVDATIDRALRSRDDQDLAIEGESPSKGVTVSSAGELRGDSLNNVPCRAVELAGVGEAVTESEDLFRTREFGSDDRRVSLNRDRGTEAPPLGELSAGGMTSLVKKTQLKPDLRKKWTAPPSAVSG
jgi:hypothetical protein